MVPSPCQHYSKTLGGSVRLGAAVIVAERGIADFDRCSFESHVPRVPDVVKRDLSFISIILSSPNSSGVARTRPPTVLGQFGARHRIRGALVGRFWAPFLTLPATSRSPWALGERENMWFGEQDLQRFGECDENCKKSRSPWALGAPGGRQGVENLKILKFFIFWFFDLFERFYINTYDPDLHIARRSGHRSRSTHFILPLKVEPVLIDFPLTVYRMKPVQESSLPLKTKIRASMRDPNFRTALFCGRPRANLDLCIR